MQPSVSVSTSASISTSDVPSQENGGGAARGFKGKNFGILRPTKFQPVNGKGKKVAGKGTKSNK